MTIGWDIEDKYGDECMRDQRYNEVDSVKQKLPTNHNRKTPHRKGLLTPGITDTAFFCRRIDDIKLCALIEFGQINAVVYMFYYVIMTF